MIKKNYSNNVILYSTLHLREKSNFPKQSTNHTHSKYRNSSQPINQSIQRTSKATKLHEIFRFIAKRLESISLRAVGLDLIRSSHNRAAVPLHNTRRSATIAIYEYQRRCAIRPRICVQNTFFLQATLDATRVPLQSRFRCNGDTRCVTPRSGVCTRSCANRLARSFSPIHFCLPSPLVAGKKPLDAR